MPKIVFIGIQAINTVFSLQCQRSVLGISRTYAMTLVTCPKQATSKKEKHCSSFITKKCFSKDKCQIVSDFFFFEVNGTVQAKPCIFTDPQYISQYPCISLAEFQFGEILYRKSLTNTICLFC